MKKLASILFVIAACGGAAKSTTETGHAARRQDMVGASRDRKSVV